jgi:hypothetical protein
MQSTSSEIPFFSPAVRINESKSQGVCYPVKSTIKFPNPPPWHIPTLDFTQGMSTFPECPHCRSHQPIYFTHYKISSSDCFQPFVPTWIIAVSVLRGSLCSISLCSCSYLIPGKHSIIISAYSVLTLRIVVTDLLALRNLSFAGTLSLFQASTSSNISSKLPVSSLQFINLSQRVSQFLLQHSQLFSTTLNTVPIFSFSGATAFSFPQL